MFVCVFWFLLVHVIFFILSFFPIFNGEHQNWSMWFFYSLCISILSLAPTFSFWHWNYWNLNLCGFCSYFIVLHGKVMRKVGVEVIGLGALKLTGFLRELMQQNNINFESLYTVRTLKEVCCNPLQLWMDASFLWFEW